MLLDRFIVLSRRAGTGSGVPRTRTRIRWLRHQRPESFAASTRCLHPAVYRAAMHPETRDHIARPLTIAHSLNRHRADGLKRRMIQAASVAFHRETDRLTFAICCLNC